MNARITQSRQGHAWRAIVGVVAVGVGIPGRIEPVERHPLAIAGRSQQPVDLPLIGLGRRVGQERVQLRGGRRQAGQVERHPAQQRGPVGFGRRMQPALFELGQDEEVDRVANPTGLLDGRQFVSPRRGERPVRLVLGALRDPLPQQLDLAGREG